MYFEVSQTRGRIHSPPLSCEQLLRGACDSTVNTEDDGCAPCNRPVDPDTPSISSMSA